MRLVEKKYFEKITIIEIATEANLSVGAFYRRFKSKEAALPVVYNQFQVQLREWLDVQSQVWDKLEFEELVSNMTHSLFHFVNSRKGIFRTIHLNARLNSDLLEAQLLHQRIDDFIYLSSFFKPYMQEDNIQHLDAARFAIFTLVNNAVEKCVYPDITPANGCSHNLEQSIEATSNMLTAYLKSTFAIQ